ncbi:acyltransferase family protein [Fundidesulfovibrio soli]|uniref:acyltransferase family protein n=1 Tax=Fundidesulfovibrio soli TaxID=2922716 RepID=UPI001FAF8104|nr:acyltransferase [Fundidesulfovibrio soli]
MTYTHIQALRAILCIMVAFVHVKIYLLKQGDPSYFIHVPDLIGGVPCAFFAISGYFMAFLVDRNSKHFLAQRLVRVYPMYFMVIVMAFVMRAFTNHQLNLDDLPYVMSLLPFGMGKSYKLGIEWTLVYEIWYYLICALFARPKWTKYFPGFLLAWLFACIIVHIFAFKPPQPVPNMLNIWFSIWNPSFILGALTFYYIQRYNEPFTQQMMLLVMTAVSLACLELWAVRFSVLYILGVLSCFLLYGLIKLESRVSSPPMLAQYGDYSYTLYLIHTNVIILVFDRWKYFTDTPPGLIAGLMALVLCIGGAWYLGQVDVTVHARLRVWLNKYLSRKAALSAPRPQTQSGS